MAQKTTDDNKPLQGRRILVTRPRGQEKTLCEKISELGGLPVPFPVIEITDPDDTTSLNKAIYDIFDYDIAVFISANAVSKLHQHLPELPKHLKIAAIGRATAKVLAATYREPDIVGPSPYNSEALLLTDDMQAVDEKQIIIFRGEGGRNLLAERLQERGAWVDYADCYQRTVPHVCADDLDLLWQTPAIELVTVTSDQGLQNLFDIMDAGHQKILLAMPIAVLSNRALHLVSKLGFKQDAYVANEASDVGMLNAILRWSNDQQEAPDE
ncbi:MAG: uroporphyrinogen-III synthase [Gammaproteobacteria bacterium]|nr:uroporphyrinogen-III synthase [Gammaproteobacteria bacterium]